MGIRSDSEESFEELFDSTKNMIYSLGLRLFRNDTESALDFSQEVYLQAFQKWHKFSGLSKPSTWLYSLALHLGLNRVKKERRLKFSDEEGVLEQLAAGEESMPEKQITDLLAKEELEEEIRSQLRQLPEVYRLPLILYYYEKMPYRTISQELGIKIGSLKSYIHRGKMILRKKLQLLHEDRE